MTWPINFYVIGVSCMIGLCLSTFYGSENLVENGKIESYDQLLTYYVSSGESWDGWKGFTGLYSAALFGMGVVWSEKKIF